MPKTAKSYPTLDHKAFGTVTVLAAWTADSGPLLHVKTSCGEKMVLGLPEHFASPAGEVEKAFEAGCRLHAEGKPRRRAAETAPADSPEETATARDEDGDDAGLAGAIVR